MNTRWKLVLACYALLLLSACVRPEQQVFKLDSKDPKFHTAPCKEMRTIILGRGDPELARGTVLLGTTIILGPVSGLISGILSTSDTMSDYELVEKLREKCISNEDRDGA